MDIERAIASVRKQLTIPRKYRDLLRTSKSAPLPAPPVGQQQPSTDREPQKEVDAPGISSSTLASSSIRLYSSEHPPWGWVAVKLAALLSQYPSGLTEAIVCTELQTMWDDECGEFLNLRKHETIDKIFDTKTVSGDLVYELVLEDVMGMGGPSTPKAKFSDEESRNAMNMYLHRKFESLLSSPKYAFPFKKRKVRMVGCHAIFDPVPTFLPCESMAFVLSTSDEDKAFLKRMVEHTSLQQLATDPAILETDCNILVKITDMSAVMPAKLEGHEKQIVIMVSDESLSEPVKLTLLDEYMVVAKLLHVGDVLVIHRPLVDTSQKLKLYYSVETVLMVRPVETLSKNGLSVVAISPTCKVVRDTKGTLDYKMCTERVNLQDLRPNAVNATVFGRIEAISMNMPIMSKGRKLNRYGVRLTDCSGSSDITLWEEIGERFASFLVGQYVVISNVATTAVDPKDGLFCVNCSPFHKGAVWNYSKIPGYLSSPFLYKMPHMCDVAMLENFYTDACITGWATLDVPLTVSVHRLCKRPVDVATDGMKQCRFCDAKQQLCASEVEMAYAFALDVDDGTLRIRTQATPEVFKELLGMTADKFAMLPRTQQEEYLHRLVGREYTMFVSQHLRQHVNKSPIRYRIDSVVPCNTSKRLERVLEQLESCYPVSLSVSDAEHGNDGTAKKRKWDDE